MPPIAIYYYILLLVCALTGSFLIRRHWPLWAKLLVILSWVTQAAEWMAFFCYTRRIDHTGWYTVWVFLETVVILYALFYESTLLWVKRLYWATLIMLPSGVIAFFIMRPPFAYIGLFYLFVELVASCAVLIDILKDVSDKPMHSNPKFWLATGMLFFCSLYIVVFSLGKFLNLLPYTKILPFGSLANTFMYGGFIACFIALRRSSYTRSATSPSSP